MLIRTVAQLTGAYAAAQATANAVQARVKRSALRIGLYAVAGAIAAVAIGFFIAAAWSWLAASHGPVIASLIVGAALLALALLVAAIAGVIKDRPIPQFSPAQHAGNVMAAARDDAVAYASDLANSTVGEMNGLLHRNGNTYKAALAAAAIGFVMAKILRR